MALRTIEGGAVVQPDSERWARSRQAARQTVEWTTVYRPVEEIIAETDDEMPMLVDGLVPRGWLGMVVADTKVGKTRLMLQLARAVGLGEPFLGRTCGQGRVLLTLVDDPVTLSKQRLKESLEGVPGVRACIGRWDKDTLPALKEAVREWSPDLVVVDTLVKSVPGNQGTENDSAWMDKQMERFAALTANQKTTVIVLHHLNKEGGYRGSTAIPSAAPLVWTLKPQDGESERGRTIKMIIDWKLPPVEPLILVDEDDQFTALGTPWEARRANLKERVVMAVRAGYDRQTSLCEYLHSNRHDTLKCLNELVAEGKLIRTGTGQRGSPLTYAGAPGDG